MRVTLVTNHTQNGVQYRPGDEIDMTPEDAAWYCGAIMDERFEQARAAATPIGKEIKLALTGESE